MALGLMSVSLLTYFYGLEDFGRYAFGTSIFFLLNSIVAFGWQPVVNKHAAQNRVNKNNFFKIILFQLLIFCVAIFIFNFYGHLLNDFELIFFFVLASVYGIVHTSKGILEGKYDLIPVLKIEMYVSCVVIILRFVIAKIGFGIEVQAQLYCIERFLNVFIFIYFAYVSLGNKLDLEGDQNSLTEMLREAFLLAPSSMLDSLGGRIEILLIGNQNPLLVGGLAIVLRLVEIIAFLFLQVLKVVKPKIFKLKQKSMSALNELMANLTRIVLFCCVLFSILACVVINIWGAEVLTILNASQFIQSYFIVMIWIVPIIVLNHIYTIYMQALDMEKRILARSFLNVTITLILTNIVVQYEVWYLIPWVILFNRLVAPVSMYILDRDVRHLSKFTLSVVAKNSFKESFQNVKIIFNSI